MPREFREVDASSQDIVIAPDAINYINTASQAVSTHFKAEYISVQKYFERGKHQGTYEESEFSLTSVREFNMLWNKCFGEYGYMNSYPKEILDRAKQTITQAYVLAEYGHFTQKRRDGKPYIVMLLK